jgi:hypothetical protein
MDTTLKGLGIALILYFAYRWWQQHNVAIINNGGYGDPGIGGVVYGSGNGVAFTIRTPWLRAQG